MRKCCVLHCPSTDRTILSHRFPKQLNQAEKWQKNLGLTHLLITELLSKYVVCTLHFKKSDYRNVMSNFLNATAVPHCIWYNESENLSEEAEATTDPHIIKSENNRISQYTADTMVEEENIDDPPEIETMSLLTSNSDQKHKIWNGKILKKRKYSISLSSDDDKSSQYEILEIMVPEKQSKPANNMIEYLDDFSSTADDENRIEAQEQSEEIQMPFIEFFKKKSTETIDETAPNQPVEESDMEVFYLDGQDNNEAINYQENNTNLPLEILISDDTNSQNANQDSYSETTNNFAENIINTDIDKESNLHEIMFEEPEEEEEEEEPVHEYNLISLIEEEDSRIQEEIHPNDDEEEGEFKGVSRKELIEQINSKDKRINELEKKLESIQEAQAVMAKSMEAFKVLFNTGS